MWPGGKKKKKGKTKSERKEKTTPRDLKQRLRWFVWSGGSLKENVKYTM